MKVAILSESPADEAAVRILVGSILVDFQQPSQKKRTFTSNALYIGPLRGRSRQQTQAACNTHYTME